MKKLAAVLISCLTFLFVLSPTASALTPWAEAGVSESFYKVAEDFSARYMELDQDALIYSRGLDAAAQYLAGELSQERAAACLNDALSRIQERSQAVQTQTIGDSLREMLRTCGISPEEYELFANSRLSELQNQQFDLENLIFYLEHAEEFDFIQMDLRYHLTVAQAMLDCMRDYYYYGCFNYWFTDANEKELTHLQTAVVPQIQVYRPAQPAWYNNKEAVEARVMSCLDEVEAITDQLAIYLGKTQTDLYQMEQDYQDLLALLASQDAA